MNKLTISNIVRNRPDPVDVVEYIMRHLLAQKIRSFDHTDNVCLYHGPGGLTCAVGCLIPASTNTEKVEGSETESAFRHLYSERTRRGLYKAFGNDEFNYMHLLDVMQRVHDKLPGNKTFTKTYLRKTVREELSPHKINKPIGDAIRPTFRAALARL